MRFRLPIFPNIESTHLPLACPCKVPFFTEFATATNIWHCKHRAICVHSSKDGRTKEWPDRDRKPAVTLNAVSLIASETSDTHPPYWMAGALPSRGVSL